MPVLLNCFLESECWNFLKIYLFLFIFLDRFLLCLLVVLSSLLKAMVNACGFVLVLLQLVWPFCSSRNILILLVWISTSAAWRAFRGAAATSLAAETCLMSIFCPFGWGKPSLFCPWLRSCWMAFVGCLSCSFSALFVPTQVAVPCSSSLRPRCQEAAKHILVYHFLQVEKGWKWQ